MIKKFIRNLAVSTALGFGIFSAASAQNDPLTPSPIINPDGSQEPSQSQCDGIHDCPSNNPQANAPSSQNTQLPNGPRMNAGPQESARINQNPRGVTQQRKPLPPEPLTEFQKFAAATTGQLLPIYGATLFRDVPTTFAPSDLSPVTSDYVIGPDDELRLRIWGQVNYSGNLLVNRSGDIYLPEAGTVHVAGLTFAALDQHLRSAFGRIYRNFDLSVDMGRIRSIQIYVTGQARRPGAYTVSSLSSLVDALFASGGPSAQGSLRHIEVHREGKTVGVFDLYALLIHGDKSKDIKLLPEDVLFIPPVGPQVAITGSIRMPGIYELTDGETIATVLAYAGETSALASSARLSVDRIGDREFRQAFEIAFDSTGLATPLRNGDIVRIYATQPVYRQTVTLRGNVANPGRFAWHAGMHLSDLIPDKDSLLRRDYWWNRSHLGLPSPEFEPFLTDFEVDQQRRYRHCVTTTTGKTATDSVDPAMGSQSATVQCTTDTEPGSSANDAITPSTQKALNNALTQANQPTDKDANAGQSEDSMTGNQTVGTALRLQDAPKQGNRVDVRLTEGELNWDYAVIERVDAQTLKTSLIAFDLGKLVLDHDASQNLIIEPGDTITIFSQSDIRVSLEKQTKYVRLEGEFLHSGIYSVNPGETLRDLIRRAGGFTPHAYLYGSEFDRESTRKLQQERIDEYVRRTDLDSERGSLALMANPSSSSGTVTSTNMATAAEAQLVARLKQIRATGRIVLKFTPTSANVEDVPPVALENGDRFIVPSTPSTVNIVGAVYDQNTFLFQQGASAGEYLQMAGGPDRNADYKHAFVIRADGSVVSRDAVKGAWGNNFKSLGLNPGDTIVVPDKTIRPTALRGLLDWTQIFSQLALGAAAVEVLRQ